ncbi:hypothetical protein QL285_096514 [Trifolium repens]|nr:hypothetical protein QL285_096514 [Trifolium repens]
MVYQAHQQKPRGRVVIAQSEALVAGRLPAMKQARRGRVVIAQSEAWRHLVAGGRYWSPSDHMNFWVREEHMNPRLQRQIGGLASKPRFSCSALGFTYKSHKNYEFHVINS